MTKKFERVLSTEYITHQFESYVSDLNDKDMADAVLAFGIAIEQAAIEAFKAQLTKQEPVAWAAKAMLGEHYFNGDLAIEAFCSKEVLLDEYSAAEPLPLYAYPMPNSQGFLDSSEPKERPTIRCNDCWWHGNEDDLALAVAADYPDDEPAKVCPNCKKLGCLMDLEGANHIADARKMVTPLAKRKIQSKIDEGEYRYLKGATVLVNEHGRAAIVNYGGAFYWVENADMYVEFHRAETQFELDHIPDTGKMVAEMYWINPDYPSSDSIIEAFEPITSSVKVNVGDRYEISRAIRLPDMTVEVTELEENGDVKAYKVVGGGHIPADSKIVNDADEALRDALDLVGLDISAYSSPKEALAAIIDWHVSVATNSRTNGGWQLVPVEPTEEMLDAACLTNGTSGDRYKAMLAAAPNSARNRNRT